ncbi:DUF1501 domain-containing protein [Tropicibacter sp. R16_0]|uniref:DUF1501 domain-containing protein n=1 Tax=Tropicibacter sp. R16_0 TaxID=2821102 RepID=UPI001ADB62E9|nr:DUF1501 domain-containing protein [Tropicibacter sp. R16_0]MBO9448868.1 DUF1501 domain-containing protein [Tropicibacter sp. R16_0]
MSHPEFTRRGFLHSTGLAMAGTAAMTMGLPGLARASGGMITPQRKALVFIMLDGGNDSYNMLVPTDRTHHKQYSRTRGNLAIGRRELLGLDGPDDAEGRSFGLHASMPEVQKLYNRKKLAFVANVGPLVERLRKEQFYDGSAQLPLGLLSHADQFKHWQTSRPDVRENQGWFGHFADQLQPSLSAHEIPMNISLAGHNIQQNGAHNLPYSIKSEGSVGLYVKEEKNQLNEVLLDSFTKLMNEDYAGDPFMETYLGLTRDAQAKHEVFRDATRGIKAPGRFSGSDLSQQLRMVARTIKAANRLGLQQQTFFLRYIGWDHHDELLNNQGYMLGVLSRALGEFQHSLEEMGIDDRVVTFTGSDFGRTLTSNGNGTDHGWGGNTIVMGTPVQGGRVYGEYPSLGLGNDNLQDVGDGVLIPTTSTDQLYADLSLWFGVQDSALNTLFPNLHRFTEIANGGRLGLFA